MLKKEFNIMFNDLTPEAQERYCKTFDIDIGDIVDFPIATAIGYTDDKGNCQNWSKLAKELGVDHVVSGPYYELWSLDSEGDKDEIIEEGDSIEELHKYAEEHNLYSDDDTEYVIEEVYEVSDDEDEDDTYYLAAERITL